MRVVGSDSVLTQVLDSIAATRGNGDGDARRGLAAVEVEMRRGEMTPLHVHGEDEAVRVLEGSVVVYAGDAYVRLVAGEAYVAPRRVPHVVAEGPTGARYLTTTFAFAVGRYQDFVRAVALPALAAEGSGIEEERALALTAEANGIRVLGPPGSLPGSYVVAA
jgi:quercetin dioxygenase-like cupin family protein